LIFVLLDWIGRRRQEEKISDREPCEKDKKTARRVQEGQKTARRVQEGQAGGREGGREGGRGLYGLSHEDTD